MAREYGKVLMSAWNDREFCALPRRAQGTYFFLTSQSDLNRAGVITMALNRWASRCGENDRQVILEDLATLARGRFVVVDEDEEEVLIRSYIRNDEGWKSPNVMVAVGNAARQISSETLRAVIAEELVKIDTSSLSTAINKTTNRSTREFIESVIATALRNLGECEKNPSVMDWGRVTERVPDSAKIGRVTERVPRGFLTETETSPETKTQTSPETSTAEIGASESGFDEFWEIYDKKRGRKAALAKWKVALKKPGVTPELLVLAASQYVAYQRTEGKHPEFTKDPTTWLNGEHWNDERAGRQQSRPAARSKAEERMAANLAVVEELKAQEQSHLRAIGGGR